MRRGAGVRVTRAGHDQESVVGELPGDLTADAPVSPGDHGHRPRFAVLAGCCPHGAAAGDSDGGRNAANGLVTTRVRVAKR